MTGTKSKFKEIILGILTGITLWIVGHMLSGRLSFVEDIKLYETGILVFIFPLLAFAFCIWLAKYAAKKRTETYFKASLITLFVPVFAYVLCILLSFFDFFGVVDMFIAILSMFVVPAFSIVLQMFEGIDKLGMSELASSIMMILINLIPMLAGLVCSVIMYRKASALRS